MKRFRTDEQCQELIPPAKSRQTLLGESHLMREKQTRPAVPYIIIMIGHGVVSVSPHPIDDIKHNITLPERMLASDLLSRFLPGWA